MADKELKNRTPIGSAIDKKLYEELKQYSKDTGVPMSKLLDRAISLLLESTKNSRLFYSYAPPNPNIATSPSYP